MATETMEKVKQGEMGRDEQRALAAGTFDTPVDAQGRISIDRGLRDFAGLELNTKVVVSGSFDRVEIWNAQAYDERGGPGRGCSQGRIGTAPPSTTTATPRRKGGRRTDEPAPESRSSAVSRSARWTAPTPPASVSLVGEKSRRQPPAGGLQMSEITRRLVRGDRRSRSRKPVHDRVPPRARDGRADRRDLPARARGVLVDATVGGGGHARLLLEARPDLLLVGIDRDPAALAAAAEALAPFGDRVTLRHARFDHLNTVMTDLQTKPVSGVLFDLGVSSPQLDEASGASPIATTARRHADGHHRAVVGGRCRERLQRAELVRVLQEHGDERFAIRIAAAIVAQRPIETTAQLAGIVRDAIPAAGPPARWSSRQAHVPGHPHRGQQRAADPARRHRRRHRR